MPILAGLHFLLLLSLLTASSLFGSMLATSVVIGILLGQQTMLGMYAGSFRAGVFTKIRNVCLLSIAQFLCVLAFIYPHTDERPVPIVMLVCQAIWLLSSFFGACLFSFISRRRISHKISVRSSNQYGIGELLIWFTAFALLLTVSGWFSRPLPETMLGGIQYFFALYLSVVVAAPICFILSVSSIGVFSSNEKIAKRLIVGLSFAALSAAAVFYVVSDEKATVPSVIGFLSLLVSVIATLTVLRHNGFRLSINRKLAG